MLDDVERNICVDRHVFERGLVERCVDDSLPGLWAEAAVEVVLELFKQQGHALFAAPTVADAIPR